MRPEASGGVKARARRDLRSGLGHDAEHGSGSHVVALNVIASDSDAIQTSTTVSRLSLDGVALLAMTKERFLIYEKMNLC